MTPTPTLDELMQQLYSMANPANVEGQRRFGICAENMLGISIYDLRRLARGIRDHELAQQLWASGIHEARLLAALLDEPEKVTREQMNRWVAEFDSWDICDQVTDNLFASAVGILDLIPQWAERQEEYVRRAAFAATAVVAWNGKQYSDEQVAKFLPLIEQYASDPRNFVKKAVNWALRNIGKRRPALRSQAVALARRLMEHPTPSARWIGRDAMKEFETKFGPQPTE